MARVFAGFACALALSVLVALPAVAMPEAAGNGASMVPAVPGLIAPKPFNSGPSESAEAETASSGLSPLVPAPKDSASIDEVEIPSKMAAVVSASSSWGDGFKSLSGAFEYLNKVIVDSGLTVAGLPLAVFTQTDDDGFKFDAMVPIGIDGESEEGAAEALRQSAQEINSAQTKNVQAKDAQEAKDAEKINGGKANAGENKTPEREEGDAQAKTGKSPDVSKTFDVPKLGRVPGGKAFRFVHQSPYDDIDTTYEAIAAYLDSKNIVARDIFIEEYATDLTTPDDEALEVYIYVLPKDAPASAPAPATAE